MLAHVQIYASKCSCSYIVLFHYYFLLSVMCGMGRGDSFWHRQVVLEHSPLGYFSKYVCTKLILPCGNSMTNGNGGCQRTHLKKNKSWAQLLCNIKKTAWCIWDKMIQNHVCLMFWTYILPWVWAIYSLTEWTLLGFWFLYLRNFQYKSILS